MAATRARQVYIAVRHAVAESRFIREVLHLLREALLRVAILCLLVRQMSVVAAALVGEVAEVVAHQVERLAAVLVEVVAVANGIIKK